jgi:hypothetical protein
MPQGKNPIVNRAQTMIGGVPKHLMKGINARSYMGAAYPVNAAGRMINALGNPNPDIAKEMATVELLKLLGNAGQDTASAFIGPAAFPYNLAMDTGASVMDPEITDALQKANKALGLQKILGMEKVVDDPNTRRDFIKAATSELPSWMGTKGPALNHIMSLFNAPAQMAKGIVDQNMVYPLASNEYRKKYNQSQGHPFRDFVAIDESDKRQRDASDMGPVKGRVLTDKNKRSSPLSINYERPDMQGGRSEVPSRVSKYPQFRSGRIPSE